MLRQPFEGTVILTNTFRPKGDKNGEHLGEDYALSNRTALIAVSSGKVVKFQPDIKKVAGKVNWIANYYSDKNHPEKNDPYIKRVGKIIYARPLRNEDYGNFIKIDHGNGVSTLCAHMDEVSVYEGQSVVEGQLIGYSDNSGNAIGSGHVHFELRKNDWVIDPNKFDFKSFKGLEVTNTPVIKINDKVKITVNKLYVRSGPSRTYPLLGSKELHRNDEVDVVGFTEGEEIDSNKLWYISTKGNSFWSGGTDKPNPKVSESEIMTREENDKKKLELESKASVIEARRVELEEAVKSNASDKEAFDAEYAAFVAEPVEEPVIEVPAEVVEAVVEEPVAETPVDVAQDEKISKLEKMYEELKALLGK